MKFHGINSSIIKKSVISIKAPDPFDCEILYNERGLKLMWSNKWKGFRIITNDTAVYLDDNELPCKWFTLDDKLYNVEILEDKNILLL